MSPGQRGSDRWWPRFNNLVRPAYPVLDAAMAALCSESLSFSLSLALALAFALALALACSRTTVTSPSVSPRSESLLTPLLRRLTARLPRHP